MPMCQCTALSNDAVHANECFLTYLVRCTHPTWLKAVAIAPGACLSEAYPCWSDGLHFGAVSNRLQMLTSNRFLDEPRDDRHPID